jgi:hypothetical protein
VALALAHAKSADPDMIAGYAGKGEALDEAIARVACALRGSDRAGPRRARPRRPPQPGTLI